jgi:LacI family transcriptional regulator|tara:strand:+ start:34457 stop:35476 length:1020 start_codon:yes stop_codon:yes gene_type:complete
MDNKKATIKDVASHSQVSIKTVSRVINNEYGVSKITKSRVLNSIKALDYNPNKAAQGLRSKKSFLIGLVYDNPDKFYLSDIQSGVLETCAINGFSVVLFPCNYQKSELTDELIEFIKKTNLDGLILTPPISDMKELVKNLQLEIPLCVVSPGLLTSNPLWVSSDDFKASYDMTCHLINQGHRDIGFIKGHKGHGATQHRLDGYLNALSDNNIKIDDRNITEGDFSFDSGEIAAKKLLKNKSPKITAIFASNDAMAAGVMKAAHKAKINIPDKISLVGFDNSPTASQAWPSITTIGQPIKEMASYAAQILIDNISNKSEKKNVNKTFDSELIFRESVRKI